jgi:hypothetical protein
MFFFKNKTVTVDAFTYLTEVHTYAPVDKAKNFLPDWWKNHPKNSTEMHETTGIELPRSTIKRCVGIIDLYANGYIIPMWTSVKMKTTSTGNFKIISTGICEQSTFQEKAFPRELMNNNIHTKITSPWIFREKTGINFLFVEPTWNYVDNLAHSSGMIVPPGIINFKYQTTTNINIFLPLRDQVIDIEMGTPMAHIIPMTDKKVQLKTHLVDRLEFDRLTIKNSCMWFANSYHKTKSLVDSLENNKKCPFKF